MGERFQTTQWSIVIDAGGRGDGARNALSMLCETYRPPVLAYIRARVRDRDDAEDLTQAFFTQLLERDFAGRADRDRGRFRSFLLKSLNHFIATEWERRSTLRRGGDATVLSDEVLGSVASDDAGPEQLFEQEWARSVLREAMRRLETEASNAGRDQMFIELRPYLVDPPDSGEYDEIASRVGMRRNTIAVAVHRLRSRLQELVQDVIADTASDALEVQEEMRQMREVMSRRAGAET